MTKVVSLSQNLVMISTVGGSENFQAYLQFAPTSNQATNTIIPMVNAGSPSSIVIGTLAGEQTAWPALYSKTKIHKIVVKYIPAQTCGMGGYTPGTTTSPGTLAIPTINFSQAAVMYTIPIYDNVDDLIDNTGKLLSNDVQTQLVKPYVKAHSIYKPWTRVLTPKQYMTYTSFQGAQIFKPIGGYFDLDNVGTLLDGLWMGMEPLTQGGLQQSNINGDQNFPPVGFSFVLGEIQMTVYQSFKVRT